MKKLTLILACIMVFASIAAVNASAAVTYNAPYATTAPTIDGKADAAWNAATAATMSVPDAGNTGSATAPIFKVMHDETYLYLFMQYTDTNGTIAQQTKLNGEPFTVGAESIMFAFIDDEGKQQEFMFTGPAEPDGSYSMNVYVQEYRTWKRNLANVGEGEEGFVSHALRTGDQIIFEMRLPKAEVGTMDNTVLMEAYLYDSGAPSAWGCEEFGWAATESITSYNYIKTQNTANFGTITLAAAPAGEAEDTSADNTEDTTAKQEESTTAKQEESTTAKQESTTANEPTTGGSTTAPTTADMGLAVAAVVMAAAAMIVLKKKH